MKPRLWIFVVGVSLCLTVPGRAGMFTRYQYDSDGNSGISTQYTYTQAIDMYSASSGETINGVTFSPDSAANRVQYHYDVTGFDSTGSSSSANETGQIRNMELHYVYDSQPNVVTERVTISNLTIGYMYTTTFYDQGSGSAGGQYTRVTDGDGVHYVYDEDYTGLGKGNALQDTFIATTTTYTYTFERDATDSNLGDPNSGNPNVFYLYGFSNRVTPVPEPSTFALLGISSVMLAGYAWKRRRKLAT
jgi:hypothetical protein